MTYFASWLTIISLVIATIALGYFLNRFALNRRQPVGCTARVSHDLHSDPRRHPVR